MLELKNICFQVPDEKSKDHKEKVLEMPQQRYLHRNSPHAENVVECSRQKAKERRQKKKLCEKNMRKLTAHERLPPRKMLPSRLTPFFLSA